MQKYTEIRNRTHMSHVTIMLIVVKPIGYPYKKRNVARLIREGNDIVLPSRGKTENVRDPIVRF